MLSSTEPGQERISVWDLLGEGFLNKAAKLGMYVVFIPLLRSNAVSEGKLLDESDLSLLWAYALKVEDGLTDKMFNKFCFVFPQASINTLKNTEKCSQFLSGFQPVCYDCCPSSCVCFTGPYETLSKCPKCDTDQYKDDGTPQAYFKYLSIIPHLHAVIGNSHYARKMQYQSKHHQDPTKMTDIFDGDHYHSLQESFVTIAGEELPTWFFSDPHNIALGFSTDGFGPFKHCTKTAWLIIIISLPRREF